MIFGWGPPHPALGHRSVLSWPVTMSTISLKPPIASTVTDPGATSVRPASSTLARGGNGQHVCTEKTTTCVPLANHPVQNPHTMQVNKCSSCAWACSATNKSIVSPRSTTVFSPCSCHASNQGALDAHMARYNPTAA